MNRKSEVKSWWQTVPGLLTGVAACIVAITGLLGAAHQMGFFTWLQRYLPRPAVEERVERVRVDLVGRKWPWRPVVSGSSDKNMYSRKGRHLEAYLGSWASIRPDGQSIDLAVQFRLYEPQGKTEFGGNVQVISVRPPLEADERIVWVDSRNLPVTQFRAYGEHHGFIEPNGWPLGSGQQTFWTSLEICFDSKSNDDGDAIGVRGDVEFHYRVTRDS